MPDARDTGARLGVVLGLSYGLAFSVLPGAVGGTVVLGVSAIQALVGAWVFHHRTPFRLLTAGFALAGVAIATIGIISVVEARRVPEVMWSEPWSLAVLAYVPLALWLDTRRHPEAAKRWEDAVANARVVDLLTFRSVPDLRRPGASSHP